MLIDPDGTRHYLGAGDAYTTATYQTTDRTHITFVGSAAYGGTLYYNDGNQLGVGVINNRLVIGSVKDSNGNYVGIAYKIGVTSPLAIDFAVDRSGFQEDRQVCLLE